jgi:hypothetical protein
MFPNSSMPTLVETYRRSLKMPEAEEIADLLFYRPLAFLFVQAVRFTPLTPNQVTFLSLAAGLAAAWNFSSGLAAGMAVGAAWYAASNILDCADGQLARLKNSGTPLGRLIDGIADYISSIAIFLAIGHALTARGESDWFLVVAAGLSSALHAILFDHYQGEYISTVRGEANFLHREIAKHTAEGTAENGVSGTAVGLYLRYLHFQKRLGRRHHPRQDDPAIYRRHHRVLIRLWSFLGPTTNRTLLIVSALAGDFTWYLKGVTLILNPVLILLVIAEQVVASKMRPAINSADGRGEG